MNSYIKAQMAAIGNKELILNGKMEGAYTNGVALNWSSTRGTPTENSTTQYAGIKSQKITNPAGNTGTIISSSNPAIVIGKHYRFSFYAKNINGSGGDGRDVAHAQFANIQISNTAWTFYSVIFVAAYTNIQIAFFATTNASASENGICFDNVSLKCLG